MMPKGTVLSDQILKDAQYELLTQPALSKLLEVARQSSDPKTPLQVYITHAWPVTESEQESQPLGRLLHLVNLLKKANIDVQVDFIKLASQLNDSLVDPMTCLQKFLLEVEQNCQQVLMLGSPSYQAQAKISDSFTAQEV